MAEIARVTRSAQTAKHAETKAWRRRHFATPITLAVLGIIISIAAAPRPETNDSSFGSTMGLVALTAGVVWLIANAVRATKRLTAAQEEREAETVRLLTVAREAAAATYAELGHAADEARGAARTDATDGERVDPQAAPSAETAGSPDAAADIDAAGIDSEGAGQADAQAAPARNAEDRKAALERAREQRRAAASPPPPGQPFGVSQEGAAYLVAAWMRHLGAPDAGTTDHPTTGSIAAASARCVATVKNDAESVGAQELREFVAAATPDGRSPLFFASGSYADDAQAVAEEACVTLFTYDAVSGTLEGANELGRSAVLDGIT